jgi:hypothetical protein
MKVYLIVMAILVLASGCSRDEPELVRIDESHISDAIFATDIALSVSEPVLADLGLRLIAVSNSVAVLEHIPSGARQTGSVETPFFTNTFGRIGLILRSIDVTNGQVELTRMWSESYANGKTLREQHGRQISSEGAPSAPPNESSP